MSNQKVSVIIRNHNEEDYIGFAIQSCIDFFNNPEIIIVDNNSTDESLKVASMFSFADINVYHLLQDYTPGKAINFGVTKCLNNIILVLSAHTQITKMLNEDEIDSLLTHYVAVFGNQIPVYRGKKTNRRYIWKNFNQEKDEINYFSQYENRFFIHNAFCFYNREVLLKNKFDEKLGTKEDRYWINKMIDDYDFFYTPKLECNHFWTPKGATWSNIG